MLLDEVISALDEVIYLSRDQLQSLILKQEQAIINNNRDLIEKVRTPKVVLATSGAEANGAGTTIHDHSDRYELSVSNEIID